MRCTIGTVNSIGDNPVEEDVPSAFDEEPIEEEDLLEGQDYEPEEEEELLNNEE